MRKFALAIASLVSVVGFTLAAEVVFVKFDKEKSEVTVKDGDKEVSYKVSEDTKLTVGKETKEGKFDGEKVFSKMKEGKSKLDVTIDKDKGTITEIKVKGKKEK